MIFRVLFFSIYIISLYGYIFILLFQSIHTTTTYIQFLSVLSSIALGTSSCLAGSPFKVPPRLLVWIEVAFIDLEKLGAGLLWCLTVPHRCFGPCLALCSMRLPFSHWPHYTSPYLFIILPLPCYLPFANSPWYSRPSG